MSSQRPLALVFGGSRGIGAACVDALLRDGFDVAYTATTSTAPLAARGAGRAAGYAADVRDAAAVARAFADAARDFGAPVHAVVANAGINVPPGPLAQFGDEPFRQLVEVNIVGAFNVLREAARQVADGGAIVALTTSMVRFAVPGGGPYTATKAAVEGLVRSMAKELAPRGVRVNAVAPGPVDTDIMGGALTPERRAAMTAGMPVGRVGTADEVAALMTFLVGPDAGYITAATYDINGGLQMS